MDEVCILYYCIDGGDEEEEENEKKKSRRDDEKKKNTIGAKLYHLESVRLKTFTNWPLYWLDYRKFALLDLFMPTRGTKCGAISIGWRLSNGNGTICQLLDIFLIVASKSRLLR